MRTTTLAFAVATLLAGCASVPPRDSHPKLVERLDAAGVSLPDSVDDVIDAQGQADLDAQAALRLAFANNPRVAIALSRLDAARANSLQAGLLANPMLSLMVMRPDGGGRLQIESDLMQSLADWLQRPLRQAQAEAAQQRVEAEVLGELLTLAQQVQMAHIDAVSAEQRLRVLDRWIDLEQQGLALLERQAEAGLGAIGAALQQRRELRQLEVERSAVAAERRAALTALAGTLGLDSAQGLQLPADSPPFTLPGLDLWPLPRAEVLAAEAAVDEAKAGRRLAAAGSARWQPALGLAAMRGSDGMRLGGATLGLELPLFDRGQARVAVAEAQVSEATHLAEVNRRQVRLDIESALDYLRHLDIQAERSIEAKSTAERLRQLGEHRWRQGLMTWFEYRELVSLQLGAELAALGSERERRRAAVELARALGRAVLP